MNIPQLIVLQTGVVFLWNCLTNIKKHPHLYWCWCGFTRVQQLDVMSVTSLCFIGGSQTKFEDGVCRCSPLFGFVLSAWHYWTITDNWKYTIIRSIIIWADKYCTSLATFSPVKCHCLSRHMKTAPGWCLKTNQKLCDTIILMQGRQILCVMVFVMVMKLILS